MKRKLKIEIEDFPFVPRCPKCNTPVAYRVAPHNVPGCPLKAGRLVVSEELKTAGAKVEDSLEYAVMVCYAKYPSLYGRSAWSRWPIFNRLFFEMINGYCWKNGYLYNFFQLKSKSKKIAWKGYGPMLVKTELSTLAQATARSGYAGADRLYFVKPKGLEKESVDYYSPEKFAQHNQVPDHFDPIYEGYSAIAKVPEDAQPDWLEGCYEALAMLEYVPGDDRKDLEGRNLKMAPVIRSRLDAIKSSRVSGVRS